MALVLFTIAILLTAKITLSLKSAHKIPSQFCALLAAEHICSTLYYHNFTFGDWVKYYEIGMRRAERNSDFDYVQLGTSFIEGIVHVLCLLGDFSSLGIFGIFSCFGFVGIVLLCCALKRWETPRTRYLWMAIGVLPNLHVWTSALGKDSLVFLPLAYLVYCVSLREFKIPLMAVSAGLVFLIRPHMAFMLLVAAGLSAVLARSSIGLGAKSSISVAALTAIFFSIPVIESYVGVRGKSLDSMTSRVDRAASMNQQGDGAVDITQLSAPARIFTYMFRPLFFDVRNLLGWIASVENLFLLVLGLSLVSPSFFSFLTKGLRFDTLFCLLFMSAGWFILGMTTANLGIALRQKTQLLPFAFLIAMQFHYSKHFGTNALKSVRQLSNSQ